MASLDERRVQQWLAAYRGALSSLYVREGLTSPPGRRLRKRLSNRALDKSLMQYPEIRARVWAYRNELRERNGRLTEGYMDELSIDAVTGHQLLARMGRITQQVSEMLFRGADAGSPSKDETFKDLYRAWCAEHGHVSCDKEVTYWADVNENTPGGVRRELQREGWGFEEVPIQGDRSVRWRVTTQPRSADSGKSEVLAEAKKLMARLAELLDEAEGEA